MLGCSAVVRWSGLPRDVYCPEISTKSALFPRFGHREIGAITASLLSSDLGMVGQAPRMRWEDVSGARRPAYTGPPRNAVGVRELAKSSFRTTVGRSACSGFRRV